MPLYLIPIDRDGEELKVDKAIMFLGRHPDCDAILTDSRKVSRKHCCIAQINDEFVVRDLGSMNGIRINEEYIREETVLKTGDELWIGDIGYRIEIRNPQRRKKASSQPDKQEASQPADKALRRSNLDSEFVAKDSPVPIPEEGYDLAVEETMHKKQMPVPEEVIELTENDLIDEE